MDACLLAQHLAGRIEVLAAETAELGHRVDLLAYATGVDLERLAILDRLRRSWAYPTTWEEMAALGLDPGAQVCTLNDVCATLWINILPVVLAHHGKF